MGRFRRAGALLVFHLAGGILAFVQVNRRQYDREQLLSRRSSELAWPARMQPLLDPQIHPPAKKSSITALHATNDATNGAEQSSNDDNSSSSSSSTTKRFLTNGYAAGRYIFGAASLLILAMPDRTMTTLLATKLGGFAGFALAAGLCHILQGAASHDRLTSDTYKRLNVGLLGFCGLGLVAVPAEAAFMNSVVHAMAVTFLLTGVKLYGTALALLGWKQGVLDNGALVTFAPRRMFQEFVDGTKETAKGLKVQNNKKALTYRNCLLLVCMGIVSSFMEGLFNIRYQKEFTRTWFEISLQWSAVSRLFMISTMIYSLKDAAERDRLTGTTFIQLNTMIGFWALVVGLVSSSTAVVIEKQWIGMPLFAVRAHGKLRSTMHITHVLFFYFTPFLHLPGAGDLSTRVRSISGSGDVCLFVSLLFESVQVAERKVRGEEREIIMEFLPDNPLTS